MFVMHSEIIQFQLQLQVFLYYIYYALHSWQGLNKPLSFLVTVLYFKLSFLHCLSGTGLPGYVAKENKKVAVYTSVYTSYSKMAAVLVFFCLLANQHLLIRLRENIILNFEFKNEATRANLQENKRKLKWRPFWNKVQSWVDPRMIRI